MSRKTALVTGVNSGIGLALREKFLAGNYYVIGTCRNGSTPELHHERFSTRQLNVTDQ